METIKPSDVQLLVQGATPIQIITMIFVGIIALGIIISVVKWVVDTKVQSLPGDIKEIKNSLQNTQMQLTEVKGKLWSHDDVAREIASAIKDHALDCPARTQGK